MKKRIFGSMEHLIEEYEFKTEYEYYNYIVASLINGQRQQVRSLYNQMPSENQEDFIKNYLPEITTNDMKIEIMQTLLIQ